MNTPSSRTAMALRLMMCGWPTKGALAWKLDVDPRTIKRTIRALEDGGWTITRRADPSNQCAPWRYHIDVLRQPFDIQVGGTV